MFIAGQGAVGNAVAINVFVTAVNPFSCTSSAVSTLPRLIGSVGYSNGSDIQLFIPKSRSLSTNTGVCSLIGQVE